MRILHTADWHLGKSLEKTSRLEEQKKFTEDFIKMADKNNVDMIMIAGDIYDTPNPSAEAEKLFYNTLKRLSNGGKRLTVVIAGNHDSSERLMAARPLAMEHGVIIFGTPTTVIDKGMYGDSEVVASDEGYVEVKVGEETAIIIALPYPTQKSLGEILYEEEEEEADKAVKYANRIKAFFSNLEPKYREDTINLAMAHIFAMNADPSGSEKQVATLGGNFMVPGSCFPEKAQYVALGHVHKPQIVPGTNHRVRYSGSPIHYHQDEAHYEKQCLIVDVKVGTEAEVKPINIPIYKEIVTWNCDSIDDAMEMCDKHKDEDCYVYINVTTDRPIRDSELSYMKTTKKDVMLINTILKGDAEEEQISDAIMQMSIEDQFKEFYKSKNEGTEIPEDLLELFMEIVGEEE